LRRLDGEIDVVDRVTADRDVSLRRGKGDYPESEEEESRDGDFPEHDDANEVDLD
jgi:hypothetical protein